MKTNHWYAGLLLTLLVFLFSCNQRSGRKERSNTPSGEFTVLSYPRGIVSPHSDITVVLSEIPHLSKKSDKQLVGLFNFTPEVSGKTYRSGKRSITFQPDKPLRYNTEYNVTFDLTKVYEHPHEDAFSFEIKTLPLTVATPKLTFSPYSDDHTTWNKASVRLSFSDAVDLELLKKAITARQAETELPFTLQSGSLSNEVEWTIDSVKRMESPSEVILAIDLKSVGGEGEKTWSFPINSIRHFSLNSWNLDHKKNNVIKLHFSDPLSKDQNLNGLIYFKDGSPVKINVQNNMVSVYPQGRQKGSKHLVISASVMSSKGTKLSNAQEIDIYFKPVAPQVLFTGKGTILVPTDKMSLPFKTINLNAVDVIIFKIYAANVQQFLQINNLGGDRQIERVGEFVHHEKLVLHQETETKPTNRWENYALDLRKMIQPEPGAIYRVYLRFKKDYAILDCKGNKKKEAIAGKANSGNQRYFYDTYYYPSLYKWSDTDDPCTESYYYYNHFAEKNVMASNIGLTAKNIGKGIYAVYANHLVTGNPMSGVKLQLFSYQQQKLAEAVSGEQGFATLKSNKRAALLVAQKEGQYAYLKMRGSNALSYSKFDTKGVKAEKGLKAFVYGERGVYRPGDTLFLSFVLQDLQNSLPQGYPFTFKVFDARNKQVFSKTEHKRKVSIYVFKVPTHLDDPTGVWNVRVKVGGNTFTKRVRVEDVKPNRLKINLSIEGIADNGKMTGEGTSKAHLEAHWLSGGKAPNLKATVTESITIAHAKFDNYKAYRFDDPSKRFFPDESTVFMDSLNKQGEGWFDVYKPTGSNLPSLLKLNFTTKVFEPGSGFSIDQKAWTYAPYSRYVGIKAPQPQSNEPYLETGKDQWFDFVCIDAKGNPVKRANLRVEVYRIDWSWWYRSDEDIASYISQNYKQRIVNENIRCKNGKARYNLRIKYPNWGNYFVRIIDEKSKNSAGIRVYVDWPSWYSRKNRKAPSGASLLSITTAKKQYQVGDTIQVSFPVPKNSKILVSLEKNSRQLRWWWMKSKTDEGVVKFLATKEMSPNVYVYISVIQPHNQTVNDLPIRMYGVVSVTVNDPETILTPLLELPETIRPQSDYTLKVSEKTGKEMEYTIAVVDEGLLDLTHFKTPDPHQYFYSKEALAVKTWDLYNDVIGAFGGRLLQQFAVGGDEELNALGAKKVNRFQPVVRFLGPFILKKGQTAVHHLKMENYVGAVRVMVVAAKNGAYGKVEKSLSVKQPLMVLATLPRGLEPDEHLQLPVTVFAMDDAVKKVVVNVRTNGLFSLSQKVHTVNFDQQGEKMLFFDLSTKEAQGIGEVWVSAKSGHETASYHITLEVRNPNPRQYIVTNDRIAKGEKWSGTPKTIGMENSRKLEMTVSTLPPINIQWRLKYLIHYPYGCIEQTVSSVFPQLFLDRLVDLSEEQKEQTDKNIEAAITRLSRFQNTTGGFSYWPGDVAESDWGTSYAGHFLLLAKNRGYFVPEAMLSNWISRQQKAANHWEPNIYNDKTLNDLNQAYRLYTLALAGKPAMQAMNRLLETKPLSTPAKFRLAAAYALINRKSVAQQLIERTDYSKPYGYRYYAYSFGSLLRDRAMMLETYTLLGRQDRAYQLFVKIAGVLGKREWLSTQETAFGLYAASLFAGDNHSKKKGLEFSWAWQGKTTHQTSDKQIVSLPLNPKEGSLIFENLSDNDLFLTLTASGIPLAGETINQNENIAMDVVYRSMNNRVIDASTLKQGTDFYAEITVKNPGVLSNYKHLALRFLVPSGWEIVNTRLWDLGSSYRSSKPKYMDIRDDRVNLFFDLRSNAKKHFVILLNAAYPGTFFAPNITCEAMYNHSVRAVTGGGKVVVKR